MISERTTGRFVTTDTAIIDQVRKEAAEKIVSEFLQKMKGLGFSKEQIEEFFREIDMSDGFGEAM